MSFDAIAWALNSKAGSPSAKCVLLALAQYADETAVCWPSQQTLANQTDQSVDSVQRRLIELEQRGLITRHDRGRKNNGRYGVHFYQLHVPSVARRPSAKAVKRNQDEIEAAMSAPQVAARTIPHQQRDHAATVRSLDEPSIESSPLNPPIAEQHSRTTDTTDEAEMLKEACGWRASGNAGVFIEEDSDEWKAWYGAHKRCGAMMMGAVKVFTDTPDEPGEYRQRRGRRFKYRWPPGYEPSIRNEPEHPS